MSRMPPLAQLAVLAAAAVDAASQRAVVAAGLAVDAGSRARQGAAARLGDLVAALVAMGRALAGGQARPRGLHPVGDGVVDLVRDRAIARPAAGHQGLPRVSFPTWAASQVIPT